MVKLSLCTPWNLRVDWRYSAVLSSTPFLQASSPPQPYSVTPIRTRFFLAATPSPSTKSSVSCRFQCWKGGEGGEAGINSWDRNRLRIFLCHYLPTDVLRQSPSHCNWESELSDLEFFLPIRPRCGGPTKFFHWCPNPLSATFVIPRVPVWPQTDIFSHVFPRSLLHPSSQALLRSFLALRSFAPRNFAYANRYNGTHTPHSARHCEDVSSTLIVITCSGLKYQNYDAPWWVSRGSPASMHNHSNTGPRVWRFLGSGPGSHPRLRRRKSGCVLEPEQEL